MERIGVMTSGGDAPGMNACLKTIVEMSYNLGYECIAFHRAYQGLLENDYTVITKKDVAQIFNLGGSMIYSARSKDFYDEKYQELGAENAKKLYNMLADYISTEDDMEYTPNHLGIDTQKLEIVNITIYNTSQVFQHIYLEVSFSGSHIAIFTVYCHYCCFLFFYDSPGEQKEKTTCSDAR